jgi:hypothetical protein
MGKIFKVWFVCVGFLLLLVLVFVSYAARTVILDKTQLWKAINESKTGQTASSTIKFIQN